MSFESLETSNFDGRPVQLYAFRVGNRAWFYTSAPEAQAVGGVVYEPIAITRGAVKQSGEPQNDETPIRLPRTTPVAALFAASPPADTVWLTIRSRHIGSDDSKVTLVGIVTNVREVSSAEVEFSIQTIVATFAQPGLRLGWGRQCPYALYDKNCRVDRLRYNLDFQPTGLDGDTLYSAVLSSFPDNWFTNGYIEFVTPSGLVDRRGIRLHLGIGIRLLGSTRGVSVGDSVRAFPGCDRTAETCVSKFNNIDNCGAIPAFSGKSPFDGTPVF